MSKHLFYINADREQQRFTLHGVTLPDIVEALEINRPMIICKANLNGLRESTKTKLQYIESHELATFSANRLTNRSSFTAIDFKAHSLLESLSDHEIAELLFLCHMGRGLKGPFLTSIQNEIAFFNENDDRHSGLYIKDWSVVNVFLQRILQNKLDRDLRNLSFSPIPLSIVNDLLLYAPQGLLIDFDHAKRGFFSRQFTISFYVAGRYEDMSVLSEDFSGGKESIALKGKLLYRKQRWEIEMF